MKHYLSRNKRKKFILWIITLLLVCIYIYRYVDKNISPTVAAIAEIRAKAVTTEAINDTIKKRIKRDINYNDLIFVKYDNEGKVTLMQANTILMNSIASEVALEVQEQLRKIAKSNVRIPLNNVFDTRIVTLPSVRVQIIPQGSVAVDFATEFEASGINQTRHRIYIIIATDIRIIVPLISDNIRISTNIPIAETIIVGEVPYQYINVPKEGILDVVR